MGFDHWQFTLMGWAASTVLHILFLWEGLIYPNVLGCVALYYLLPGGSGWILSVGDYADNSFAALGRSDPREVRLEL